MKKYIKLFLILLIISLSFFCTSIGYSGKITAADSVNPYYQTFDKKNCLRGQFYTSFYNSSKERKSNIKLAAKSLDKTLVNAGEEFSFNNVVGERTEERGYQPAKIILKGKFVEGVGGGVCQVSTTLYNAVLLSGLKVTEYHPHSLPVSYIAPSFDAMVSGDFCDFKFVNNTSSVIEIKTVVTDSRITVKIFGEEMKEKYIRYSEIVEELPSEREELIYDTAGEYPELNKNECKVISFSKKGYKSVGYIIKQIDGKEVSKTLIRSDTYLPQRGSIIIGVFNNLCTQDY